MNIKNRKSYRMLFHILFWLISISVNAYVFKISNQISLLDFYYASFSHIGLITGVYLNHFILVPLFFESNQYFKYTLFVLLNSLLMVIVYFLTFSVLVDIILPNYYFVSQFNYLETFIFSISYLSFTTLLNLSESWFELQEKNKLMLITEKENIDFQLKALKSQINPHFLFNSLNVIYAEALKQSNELPEIVIKLSDILRYIIYKSKNDTIKIEEEVKLVNDYLSLHKYRINNDSRVSFDHEIEHNHNIAPMLFLPLIENSFKHGIKGDYENTFVDISLFSDHKKTIFTIKNNIGNKLDDEFDKEKGIGIENVKKRLLLLYPKRHQLTINNENNVFQVQVTLFH